MADPWEPVKPHEAVRPPKKVQKGRISKAPTSNSKFTSTSTRSRPKVGENDNSVPSVDKFVSNVMAKGRNHVNHVKEVQLAKKLMKTIPVEI